MKQTDMLGNWPAAVINTYSSRFAAGRVTKEIAFDPF